MNAVQNRLLAAAIAALLAPWLDARGIKLTEGQVIGLVGLAPIAYHALAALAQKCVAAFVLYFPPPYPTRPVTPAPNKETST